MYVCINGRMGRMCVHTVFGLIDLQFKTFSKNLVGPYKDRFVVDFFRNVYLLLVYLVTAFVPSLTACFASSPGNRRRTAVWISLDVMVDLLL